MDAYIAQARLDRALRDEFLAQNPKQWSCTTLRRNTMSKSWKPEVLVNGQWAQNNLAFATKEEAEASAFDLLQRWLLVQDYRAAESDQSVNYQIVGNQLRSVEVQEFQAVFDFDVRG